MKYNQNDEHAPIQKVSMMLHIDKQLYRSVQFIYLYNVGFVLRLKHATNYISIVSSSKIVKKLNLLPFAC